MSLCCDSTDHRHSRKEHTYGPGTAHADHMQPRHDTPSYPHEDDGDNDHDTNHNRSESQDTAAAVAHPPLVAPTPVRPAIKQVLSSGESTGRRTPVSSSRVSSFTVPRVATPTQPRPFGSLMNGMRIIQP